MHEEVLEQSAEPLAEADVVRYLEEARQGAMDAKQFSTAVRASELLGKHIGMFGKKQEGAGRIIVRWADEEE